MIAEEGTTDGEVVALGPGFLPQCSTVVGPTLIIEVPLQCPDGFEGI